MSPTQPEIIETSLDSKRQQLEELLQESEQRFRLIADATPVMISIIDSQQRYEYCNTVQKEFSGQSLEQQLSKVWFQDIHPEDRQQYKNIYTAAFNNHKKFQIKYLRRRADGEYRRVLETGIPRFSGDSNFVGYIFSCVDITEDCQNKKNRICRLKQSSKIRLHNNQIQKKSFIKTTEKPCSKNKTSLGSQRDKSVDIDCTLQINNTKKLKKGVLRESEKRSIEIFDQAGEARLQLALNAAQMGVWDWDIRKGTVIYSQREEAIFGFAPGDFERTYQAFFQCIHPEDRSRVTKANQETLENGEEYDIDYRIIWQDQTVHWIREKGAVLRDKTGKAVRMLGITIDITQSKRIEESLQKSKERYQKLAQQKELLYRISSQIRNSLNLDTILKTAVEEIRSVLQIESCLFIWYRHYEDSAIWEVVHEAKPTNLPSLLGCYPTDISVELSSIDICLEKLFQSFGYQGILNLPIQTPTGEVGVIACLNRNSCLLWNDEDIELTSCVSDQLAIAINQAELYTQSHHAATIATEKATQLEQALHSLQKTQSQLIQTEKMSSLGQLIAGLAHEINNPVSFIYGNIDYADKYIQDLLHILSLYQTNYPKPVQEINKLAELIDLNFLVEDLPKILVSMKAGAARIRDLVIGLRNFSRLDEAEKKNVDLHEGLNNTLLILQHRLKPQAGSQNLQVTKEYGTLPSVNCYPSQLNQVFMNLLNNAIDAIESCENPTIWIRTEVDNFGCITIRIIDNGVGMNEAVLSRLFDPFFTTKPIGKGTGLGLSISYQIVVEKHRGTLQCYSEFGKGTEFVITLPRWQSLS
jgi:PAS domain S-box-containing protein